MSNNPSPFGDSAPGQMPGGFGNYASPPGGQGSLSRAGTGSSKEQKKRGRKRKQESGDKAPTKRLLTTQKALAVVLALVVGAMALLLSSAPVEQVYVVRTSQSVPALSKLSAAQIEAIALPPEAVEEGAITAATADEALVLISELLDKGRVRMELAKGHQLQAKDFTAEALLASPLGPDERLVSVEASVMSAVGGQLRAGDRVDIIVVADADIRLPDGSETRRTLSNLIAYDVEIVSVLPAESQFNAISQEQLSGDRTVGGNALLPNDPVPGIYNVRVTVQQAVVLAAAGAEGELTLVARGAGASDEVVSPIDLEDVLRRSSEEIVSEGVVSPGNE